MNRSEANNSMFNLGDNKLSLPTEQSVVSSLSRKKYYLKKQRLKFHEHALPNANKSNIFDLTADNSSYSELNNTVNTLFQESRAFQNSSNISKSLDRIENPQKKTISLPIIFQSKYNFKPSIILPKVKRKTTHEKDPKYVQDLQKKDEKNIKKMKKYEKLWFNNSFKRKSHSLLQRSFDNSQKSIEKYNSQVLNRKYHIKFQEMLRDRDKNQDQFSLIKGTPKKSIPGLKGKGGSVKSLFQEVYAIQQVYKVG